MISEDKLDLKTDDDSELCSVLEAQNQKLEAEVQAIKNQIAELIKKLQASSSEQTSHPSFVNGDLIKAFGDNLPSVIANRAREAMVVMPKTKIARTQGPH